MKQILRISSLLISLYFLLGELMLFAQCSQCKAAAASKDEAGNLIIGAGINTGVLYLLALPFVMIATVGGIWWWRSRQMERSAS